MDVKRSLRQPSECSTRVRSNRRRSLPGLNLNWLVVAAGLCWLSWPAPAEAAPQCVHHICEEGPNLHKSCDEFEGETFESCVQQICQPGIDPFCCDANGLWDDNCVGQVLSICGLPNCAQICSHYPCEVGEALDPACNPCIASVCASNPSCCTDDGDPLTDDWDASCIAALSDNNAFCGYQCEPGADSCIDALPITPGKYLGTLEDSSPDGCSSEPDPGTCQGGSVWYQYTQGMADSMELSTCATQRSFAIDTTLTVYGGTDLFNICSNVGNIPPNPAEILASDDYRFGLSGDACDDDLGAIELTRLDAALPLAGIFALDPGETVAIRIAHHPESGRNPFEFRLLPEPAAWQSLLAGVGALVALSRRRARG
jgi:hypothetical protein